jgi:hypothetical protein
LKLNLTLEERIWNEATAVYADILNQASMIGNVEFTHCGRDINSVAHEIARECFLSQISCNWVEEPPSFPLQTLLDDVTYCDSRQQVSDAVFSFQDTEGGWKVFNEAAYCLLNRIGFSFKKKVVD